MHFMNQNLVVRSLLRSVILSISLMSVQEVRSSISEILATFHDETDSRIMIMAHRAGYLSANGDHLPENSLPALERALDQGMDIIEIDFRLTSDGHLVAMHDGTLDRTTNGSGPVSAKTLAEVQELRLRMPDRTLTDEYPPSLAEVVQILKGRAMLVLDKVIITNEAQMNAAMGVLRDADAVDHALFHGSHTAVQVMTILASFPEEINYAPTIRNSTAESTIAMLEALHPPAVELIFNDDQTPMLNPEVIETAKKTGTRIWINSLWASLCGGRHDARALAGEEDETWGWIANRGALIIQSDYPYTLQQYLELRSGNFFEITHDFTPPSLDGWTRIAPNGAVGEIAFHSTNHTFGNRIYWGTPEDTAGGVIVTDVTGAADYRSGAHPSAILRSPAFTLDGVVAHSPLTNDFQVEHISFRLLGGMGAQMGPSNAADVPVASVNQPQGNFLGWLGVALRRDSDGEYLIWGRRSANGQSNSGAGWQMIQWDKSILSAAIADDPPGTLYTLDLIDAAHGDWGWIALGEVQFRLAESQYTSWLSESGLMPGKPGTGPFESADGTGIHNILQFALGGDPTNPECSGTQHILYDFNTTGTPLALAVHAREGAVFSADSSPQAFVDGISYRMEASHDLLDWAVPVVEIDHHKGIEELPLPRQGYTPRIFVPLISQDQPQSHATFFRVKIGD